MMDGLSWQWIVFVLLLIGCGIGFGWLWWRAPYLAITTKMRSHLQQLNTLDDINRRDYALTVMRSWYE